MPEVSPAPASPRLTRWDKVMRWLHDQGLNLYHVAILAANAAIIFVIMAYYSYFGLLRSGDEDSQGTNRTPKMNQD